MAEDAREGELGSLDRPDGSRSSELSISVTDERLNQGKPTNIPTLVKGQQSVDDLLQGKELTEAQIEHAIKRAQERVKQGAYLPSFGTIEEAVSAAQARTAAKTTRDHAEMLLPLEPSVLESPSEIAISPPELAKPKATVGFEHQKDLLEPIGPAHLVEPAPTLGMQPIPPPEPEGEPPRKPPSRPSGPAIERPEYLPELAPGEAELAVIGPDMPEQEWLEPLPQPAGPIRQEPPPQPAQPEAKGEDLAAGKPAPAAAGEGAGAVTETNTLLRELISAIERVTEQVTEAVIELKAIHDAMGETDTGPTRF